MAIAVLLENEWVILKLAYTSERKKGRRGFIVHRELLRFSQLLEMLLYSLRRLLGEVVEVSGEGPPPRWVMPNQEAET